MANVSVSLHDEKVTPTVHLLVLGDGRKFLKVDLGSCDVFLPGFDAACQQSARQFAAALNKAADEMGVYLEPVEEPAGVL